MRALSSVWKINGVGIFTPDDFEITFDSLANEVMTDDGITHIEWIRPIKRSIAISYEILEGDEASYILNLVQGKEFTLTYPDPIDGIKTINCRSGTNTTSLLNAVYNKLWRNVGVICIEK